MMSSLPGLLSLQEAMSISVESPAIASIDSSKLHLGDKREVNNLTQQAFVRYYQDIDYDGAKLILQTPAVKLSGLKYHQSKYSQAIVVPVGNWLRQQFNILDDFAVSHVELPNELVQAWPFKLAVLYKHFYEGNYMCINVGKYCAFTEGLTDYNFEQIKTPPLPVFGCGSYSFTIEIPSIYVGPHKTGALYSFVSRIVRVHYQPDIVLEEPIDLKSETSLNPPTAAPLTVPVTAPLTIPVTAPISIPKTKRRRKNVVPSENQPSI